MGRIRDINAEQWQPLRPELTSGVSGKLLHAGAIRVVLTRVAPGGEFRPHRDAYGHLFQILAGVGEVVIAAEVVAVAPGNCIEIEPGELHGYRNTGTGELLLLSINLPAMA